MTEKRSSLRHGSDVDSTLQFSPMSQKYADSALKKSYSLVHSNRSRRMDSTKRRGTLQTTSIGASCK